MALIGPIVNNDAFFFVVIVALALFLIIAQRIQAGNATAGEAARLSPPERRKLLADQQRDRFWKLAATAASLLVIVLISAQFIYSRTAHAMSPPERVSIQNGEAQIPTSLLADHDLHHIVIDVGGTEVRVIAILDSSGHGARGPRRLLDLRAPGLLPGRQERDLPQLWRGDLRSHHRPGGGMQSHSH